MLGWILLIVSLLTNNANTMKIAPLHQSQKDYYAHLAKMDELAKVPIRFVSKSYRGRAKAKKKGNKGEDNDKSEYRTFDCYLNPTDTSDSAPGYKSKIQILKKKDEAEYCCFR